MNNKKYLSVSKNCKTMAEVEKLIKSIQKKIKKDECYICNINGFILKILPLEIDKQASINYQNDMENYHYNIFRTYMLGKLAGHCYYDETAEYEELKAFLKTDSSYDSVEFIGIVDEIDNTNARNVEFCPMPNLVSDSERFFFAQNYAKQNRQYCYYNFDGLDLVALPFRNHKFTISTASHNNTEAKQLHRYLRSFEDAVSPEELVCE